MSAEQYDQAISACLSSGSLDSTVQALTGPIEDSFLKGHLEADRLQFESIWQAIFRAAKKSSDPLVQDRLLALIFKIKMKGELKRPDGTVCKHWAGKAWFDLPALGAEMREEWNLAPPEGTPQQWKNINAFAARLNAQTIEDFGLYAIWTFRDALETSRLLTVKESSDGDQPASKPSEVSIDELLPATLEWLEYCGPLMGIYSREEVGYKKESQANDPAALGKLAQEAGLTKGGYNLDRWKFWRSRFTELSEAKDDAGGREKVAKLAHQALLKMDEAEKEANLTFGK